MKRPVEPDFIKGAKFVSDIYGTKSSPMVSIDGYHFSLTKEQKDELIQYRNKLSHYEEFVVADMVADKRCICNHLQPICNHTTHRGTVRYTERLQMADKNGK